MTCRDVVTRTSVLEPCDNAGNNCEEVTFLSRYSYGFGSLEVVRWPLVPKFAGSYSAEAVGFLGLKNPQHAFLRRGSKAVGPMS
jgi:hypothetical protein